MSWVALPVVDLSQRICQHWVICWRVKLFQVKNVNGFLDIAGSCCNACLASRSAFSLKRILEWLGIHVNTIQIFQSRNAHTDDSTRAINAWWWCITDLRSMHLMADLQSLKIINLPCFILLFISLSSRYITACSIAKTSAAISVSKLLINVACTCFTSTSGVPNFSGSNTTAELPLPNSVTAPSIKASNDSYRCRVMKASTWSLEADSLCVWLPWKMSIYSILPSLRISSAWILCSGAISSSSKMLCILLDW